MQITTGDIENFRAHMTAEELAASTVRAYTAAAAAFAAWLGTGELTKTAAAEYKAHLAETKSARSVNVSVAALNKLFEFLGADGCRLKSERIQAQMFMPESRELTKEEYKRLLCAARDNERLYYMLKTFAETGIRVSELRFITVKAVRERSAVIKNKGKTRTVLIEDRLARELAHYAKRHGIKSGSIFVTRSGKPLDRSNIWREMKALCKRAGVSEKKVFPHNFRHLFARMFHAVDKSLTKLAAVLGHSSVNTTMIYTLETSSAHRGVLSRIAEELRSNTT